MNAMMPRASLPPDHARFIQRRMGVRAQWGRAWRELARLLIMVPAAVQRRVAAAREAAADRRAPEQAAATAAIRHKAAAADKSATAEPGEPQAQGALVDQRILSRIVALAERMIQTLYWEMKTPKNRRTSAYTRMVDPA